MIAECRLMSVRLFDFAFSAGKQTPDVVFVANDEHGA
jgi:hypothetical protein